MAANVIAFINTTRSLLAARMVEKKSFINKKVIDERISRLSFLIPAKKILGSGQVELLVSSYHGALARAVIIFGGVSFVRYKRFALKRNRFCFHFEYELHKYLPCQTYR